MSSTTPSFLDLPSEIQRDIFELAAKNNQGTAAQLALVSKNVQQWMEWFLYHTVVLDFPRRRTRQFLETLDSKPPSFFATRVQRLYLTDEVNFSDAKRILSVCTGVSSLACWVHHTFEEKSSVGRSSNALLPLLPSSSSLRRLSIRIQALDDWEDNIPFLILHHPIFQNLTHLDIVNPPGSRHILDEEDEDVPKTVWPTVWESLCLLPKLRHISFGEVTTRHQDIVHSLSYLLERCPLLEDLIVLTSDRSVEDAVDLLRDDRCHVLPYFNYPRDLPTYWEDVCGGGEDFWDSTTKRRK